VWGGAIRAALLALAALVLCWTAATAEPYAVKGVKVQASGLKPELARAKAVADGELAAFNRLLRPMTLAEDHVRLPKPEIQSVRGMVRNFSIENETGQGERYAATVTYRFDRDLVRAVLEGASIPFVDSPSPPIVVLPVWMEEGKPHLWDDPNPWREAWMRLEPEDSLATFARPRGDLDDLKAIAATEAVPTNKAALNRIADIYKAGIVAIAVASVDKGKRRITVQLVDLANGRATGIGIFATGDDAAALDKTAAQVARAIEASWKRGAVAVEQNAVTVRMRASIQGLDHWIRIRQALQTMPQVRGLATVSMSAGEALIDLRFAGTAAELRRQLEQAGFKIATEPAAAPGGAETWVLTAPSVPPVKQTDLPPLDGAPPKPGEKAPDKASEKTPEKPPEKTTDKKPDKPAAPSGEPAKKP